MYSGQWSREAREYAISSGLFAGSGTTPDGQPNYMWEDLLGDVFPSTAVILPADTLSTIPVWPKL